MLGRHGLRARHNGQCKTDGHRDYVDEGYMKVIARITLREMTEDERPDEVGPTVVTANFDAMKAGAFARSGFFCAEFRKALSRDSGLAVVALLRCGRPWLPGG